MELPRFGVRTYFGLSVVLTDTKGFSRKIPTSLPGRSTRQTVSTRVHSLSTRSREPFRTSLDLTDTYGTPGDMSILFLLGRRHGANHAMFEASALHRTTMPSHATYRYVESVRSRHESMPQACATLAYITSAGGWQITRERTSAARAGRAGRSRLGPTCA